MHLVLDRGNRGRGKVKITHLFSLLHQILTDGKLIVRMEALYVILLLQMALSELCYPNQSHTRYQINR